MYDCCAFPGCGRPYRWCELHHIVHWIDGGPTDLDNLIPLCARHHHLHHEGRFRISSEPTGLVVRDPQGQFVGVIDHATPLAA